VVYDQLYSASIYTMMGGTASRFQILKKKNCRRGDHSLSSSKSCLARVAAARLGLPELVVELDCVEGAEESLGDDEGAVDACVKRGGIVRRQVQMILDFVEKNERFPFGRTFALPDAFFARFAGGATIS
jgi:hypothetical protein